MHQKLVQHTLKTTNNSKDIEILKWTKKNTIQINQKLSKNNESKIVKEKTVEQELERLDTEKK